MHTTTQREYDMRLEISNPSDKATIDCTNVLAARLAVLLLANGKYGIVDDDGENGMPIFLFGGHDEFFQEKHGMTVSEALDTVPNKEIAEALASVRLEHERSSMNDFTARAHKMADQLGSA